IVEGKVLSVRESGPTIYVNFGRRWTQDFTVTIAKRNESAFTSAGLEPKRLQGRRVRVRGYVEQRGGPWVEATRPEQIELAERN
ncbi:MAG TPA: thermonuclease family protein, partial [Stellaceae bacterium]|nr:thermonuclease family protein [Stellaceae bacterium]